MAGKFSRSWHLIKASGQVIRQDKEIMWFPVLSTVASLIVTVSFWLPASYFIASPQGADAAQSQMNWQFYALLFLFYAIAFFIVMFFNAGLIKCAQMRLDGKDPTFSDGWHAAASHFGKILGWAIVSATVGLILRLIAEKSEILGKIVAGLIGTAWSLGTYFVLPILILEDKGVWDATKQSGALFKKSWGENIIGNVGIGLIFFLLGLLGIIPIVLAIMTGSLVVIIAMGVLVLLFWIFLGIISSALNGIYNVALYNYAQTGKVSAPFTSDEIQQAFVTKKK